MSAVSQVARDVSPERELLMTLVIGTRSLDVTVRYRVSYQSRWHRGHGIDPDITILSCTYEDGAERKALAMLPRLHDAISLAIEHYELVD